MISKFLNFLITPQNSIFKAWQRTELGSFKLKLDYDIFPRPHYAFCVYHAARQAELLGLKSISVCEFGVAGGRGLMELESVAAAVEKEVSVSIEIYGFDTGEGLPSPVDYRDLPYVWKEGFYKMDQDALRAKLKRSQLVLGDVRDTAPNFVKDHDPAPMGAMFFDLDFWSSTLDSFKIFSCPDDKILPRVFCYCDDVMSAEDGGLLNDYVGQLAAIRDYNESAEKCKLTQIAGLNWTRRRPARWNEQIYVHHAFAHAKYNTYVHADSNRQLKITP